MGVIEQFEMRIAKLEARMNEIDPEFKRAASSRRSISTISRLDNRDEIDQMILSGKFTYDQIKDTLRAQDVSISKSSVGRYAKKLINRQLK